MNEVTVSVNQKAGVISCNFDEVKKSLQDRLSEFKGALFTEDSKDLAKKEVAQLRKEQKAFQSRITEVKNAHMKPFDEFKAKADELVKMYDEPINYINEQVAEFEKKRIAAKKELIQKLYDEIVSPLAEYLPLQKIYDSKWENATVKENAIRKQMQELHDSTEKAIETISGMKSDSVEKALELYKTNLSVTDAITYINNFEIQKAEILKKENEKKAAEEEAAKQREMERVREEERKKIAEEHRVAVETEQKVQAAADEAKNEVIESMTPDAEEETKSYFYKIEVGEKGKEALEMYMDSVGIDWSVM